MNKEINGKYIKQQQQQKHGWLRLLGVFRSGGPLIINQGKHLSKSDLKQTGHSGTKYLTFRIDFLDFVCLLDNVLF